MTKAEELYHKIADGMADVKQSKMFGALCLKAPNGKAGVMYRKECMIFKLPKEKEADALKLKGATVFDPMGGRPMNGWIEVPFEHSTKWKKLAEQAMDYVKTIEK